MHFAHKKNDNLYFSEGYLKASVPLLSQLKQLKPRRIYYMSIFHFFLPLLSERENYKRFTASLLRRVGKAYTQSFNLDLGSFHTIASEALKWRESEGRLSFNEERSKKCSTFQIFLRQYHMTEPFPLMRAILQWISEETYFEKYCKTFESSPLSLSKCQYLSSMS